MSGRTKEEIITDIERWAHERLANNEEVIYFDNVKIATEKSEMPKHESRITLRRR